MTFTYSVFVGLPMFFVLYYLWRANTRSFGWRRLVLALALGAAIAPNFVVPHGPVGIYAAVSLIPAAFRDPFLWWFVVPPIFAVTIGVLIVWAGARKFSRVRENA